MVEQTVNRRTDGTFGPGNSIGRQFQPGQSGNPKGRPPERPLTVALRDALDANDGEIIKVLVQTAIDRAKAGDFRYFKEIMDRVMARSQTGWMSAPTGNPIWTCPDSPQRNWMSWQRCGADLLTNGYPHTPPLASKSRGGWVGVPLTSRFGLFWKLP
jgi:hypothetical protein